MGEHKELHEKVLYPVVRVKSKNAGGSGVLVYSQEDKTRPGTWLNFCLTCEHVIDDSISIKNQWDPVLKRERKKDIMEEVTVEIFDYDGSKVISSNATKASIVAYDKGHDLALLKLHNPRKMPYVASVIPKEDIGNLHVFDSCWTSGCSLLHDPFSNPGTLTYLREIIDQKVFLMANSASIFGNSGGGLFHGESHHLLGLTSRITGIQVGFGVDLITWMGFSTHPDRLYEFFDEQEFQFLYNPDDDYYAAMKRREKRQKDALKSLLTQGEDSPSQSEEDHSS